MRPDPPGPPATKSRARALELPAVFLVALAFHLWLEFRREGLHGVDHHEVRRMRVEHRVETPEEVGRSRSEDSNAVAIGADLRQSPYRVADGLVGGRHNRVSPIQATTQPSTSRGCSRSW